MSIIDYKPREVKIPFNEWSVKQIKNGQKCCTSRREPKGEPDDWFILDGQKYVLTDVHARRLGWVAEQHFYEEGASSPEEFIKVWNKIYKPRFLKKGQEVKASYDPDKLVLVHWFKKAKEEA